MTLARYVEIKLPYSTLITPVLLPSFSSKGFPELRQIIRSLEEHVTGPVLISAYDFKYEKIQKKLPLYPELLFVDSGGYECSKITDFVEYDRNSYKCNEWNEKIYFKTMKEILLLKNNIPKVIISYDHPRKRIPIDKQIELAELTFKNLSKTKSEFLKELVIKPETNKPNEQYISVEEIIKNTKKMKSFDILGLIEKELGTTLLDSMVKLCKIRENLNKNKIQKLIHILGSLDPISTPLYFMCGADIFDGVTWLRYSFYEGLTIYQQNYWFRNHLDSKSFASRLWSFIDNFRYLQKLKLQMQNFQRSGDFAVFERNGELFKTIWQTIETRLKGGG